MKIELKALKLKYFKGVKEIEINFDKNTNIYGDNATGKTTIFDAYSWLLFGKDSANNTNFNIKTILPDGKVPDVEHEVEGLLAIDGKDIKLRKIYKEVWTKKRGSNNSVFSGHTTTYSINEVPISEGEYKARIASIIDEEKFKLISNPRYFSIDLDKKARRNILMGLADEIKDEDIIQYSDTIAELPLDKYTIEEIVAMNKSTMKKANEEIKEIPVRIDELQGTIKDFDFDTLDFNRRATQSGLDNLEKEINSGDASEELKRLNEKLMELTKEKIQLVSETDAENARIVVENSKAEKMAEEYKRDRQNVIDNAKKNIDRYSKELVDLTDELERLRAEYVKVHSQTYEGDPHCPCCGNMLPDEMIEEAVEKFNIQKSDNLKKVTEKAAQVKASVEEASINHVHFAEIFKEYSAKPENITIREKEFIEYPDRVIELNFEIVKIQDEIKTFNATDNTELKERREKLRAELQELNSKLAYKKANEEANGKIEALKLRERELAKVYSEAERMLIIADGYNRIKAEMMEKNIRKKFKYVEFKLFETQINGGINEVCEATVNGVPYSDVNNAGKINAGLDIINTLSAFYGVSAPIFIDNAESVNELIKTKSQIIRLVVSTDQELRIDE